MKMTTETTRSTEEIHNPDDECWTVNCKSEWTVVLEQTEINRKFGYCEQHAEMWGRLATQKFERVR